MNELGIALQKQIQEIEDLKKYEIQIFKGFGKEIILTFSSCFQYPDGDQGLAGIQNKIKEGYYKSIEDFDSYHTADIEFIDLYSGPDINEYREKTKSNLIELGREWRNRVCKEYPEADITIVVHKQDDDWYLDTFNYKIKIETAVYI